MPTTPRPIQRVFHSIGYATRVARFGVTSESPEHTDESGFTLIEAVVSFVLFAIVATASVTAVTDATKSSNTSRNSVAAANLAQQDLQQARSLADRTTLANWSRTVRVGTKTYTVARTVSATCPAVSTATGVTTVDVTSKVTWSGNTTGVSIATRLAC